MEENRGKKQKVKGEKKVLQRVVAMERERNGKRGERNGEDKQRVKDEFPGGSVKLYWWVSLSLIVSLPWL